MQVGSEEHKELFCRSFIASHERYEPSELPWPDLDERSLSILRSIPVWSSALQVEVNAGAMLSGFADSQRDVLIQQALRLQGYEEDRHGRMLSTLVERYQLHAPVEPPQLQPTRQAFIDFGYNECLDSFLGFGVFRIARSVQFMPDSLMSLFTRVLWEEARHIVFFVNWIAYERTIRGYGNPVMQAIPTAIGYARALQKTLGRAGQSKTEDKGMSAAGDIFTDLTLSKFLQACLTENDMHMAKFDKDLVRPRVVPSIARFALSIVDTGGRVQDFARRTLART
jgi:hypothetical protein